MVDIPNQQKMFYEQGWRSQSLIAIFNWHYKSKTLFTLTYKQVVIQRYLETNQS